MVSLGRLLAAAAHGAGPKAGVTKRLGLKDVQHIVAVSSAKGGVGKSTTAVNVAVALATALSLRVGLLDADIHGPSIGKMMNLRGKPELTAGALLRPRENFRVKTMSFSFFMDGDAPAVLRGPMVGSAFEKMLFGTEWGALDVLVVDMPPGTGDAQINLGQRTPLSGALITSTPQDVALLDVKRGVQAFNLLRVPILGLVENMSHHVCGACGHKEHTFGRGGVEALAVEFGLPLLGQVPLDAAICTRSDAGAPIVASDPSSASARAYVSIAERLWETLRALGAQGRADPAARGPSIVVE
ncbi:hypothetical protein FOA52_016130 [Chlamydomonas sp. UWO 241]|nr:hypothetical protein FOA52_016130 [Chlamydomonas sp. UWO 241]